MFHAHCTRKVSVQCTVLCPTGARVQHLRTLTLPAGARSLSELRHHRAQLALVLLQRREDRAELVVGHRLDCRFDVLRRHLLDLLRCDLRRGVLQVLLRQLLQLLLDVLRLHRGRHRRGGGSGRREGESGPRQKEWKKGNTQLDWEGGVVKKWMSLGQLRVPQRAFAKCILFMVGDLQVFMKGHHCSDTPGEPHLGGLRGRPKGDQGFGLGGPRLREAVEMQIRDNDLLWGGV
eukprot:gene2794-biopygen15643